MTILARWEMIQWSYCTSSRNEFHVYEENKIPNNCLQELIEPYITGE